MNRDAWAALMLVAMGAGVTVAGLGFHFGSLRRMGPGFLPVVIGVLLAFVGLLLGATALAQRAARPESLPPLPVQSRTQLPFELRTQWRGWICIVGGVAAFVVLGRYGGLVPASFVAVFVAALGDRRGSIKSSLALAAALTLFCVVVFHMGLHLQLPLFQWG